MKEIEIQKIREEEFKETERRALTEIEEDNE
jgi:hypothetical protein